MLASSVEKQIPYCQKAAAPERSGTGKACNLDLLLLPFNATHLTSSISSRLPR